MSFEEKTQNMCETKIYSEIISNKKWKLWIMYNDFS